MMRILRRSAGTMSAIALIVAASPVGAQTPEPYRDPPFACDVIDYGTDPPPIPGPDDDPLCVRYDKTNITVSTLEAVDFLAAEPGRVAIAAAKCSFWQQDEWAIRAAPDTPVLVGWTGSYWYDATSGSAAGILRDLRVADQPASADAFIEAVRPIVGDEQADAFAAFTDEDGGGGLTMALPDGFAFEECATGSDDDGGDGSEPDPEQGDEPGAADPTSTSTPVARTAPASLPATGVEVPLAVALVMLAVGAAGVRSRMRSPRRVSGG